MQEPHTRRKPYSHCTHFVSLRRTLSLIRSPVKGRPLSSLLLFLFTLCRSLFDHAASVQTDHRRRKCDCGSCKNAPSSVVTFAPPFLITSFLAFRCGFFPTCRLAEEAFTSLQRFVQRVGVSGPTRTPEEVAYRPTPPPSPLPPPPLPTQLFHHVARGGCTIAHAILYSERAGTEKIHGTVLHMNTTHSRIVYDKITEDKTCTPTPSSLLR